MGAVRIRVGGGEHASNSPAQFVSTHTSKVVGVAGFQSDEQVRRGAPGELVRPEVSAGNVKQHQRVPLLEGFAPRERGNLTAY